MTQVNDVNVIETKFYRALGDGKKAGEHLQSLIKSVVTSRDTTILCKAIKRAEEKGDKNAASVVRFVASKVWPGAKASKDKNGMLSIKIKGIEANDEALTALKEAVDKGLSIRHSAFRKCFNTDKEEKPFDPTEWAKRTVKQRGEENLDAMIAALQALRS